MIENIKKALLELNSHDPVGRTILNRLDDDFRNGLQRHPTRIMREYGR